MMNKNVRDYRDAGFSLIELAIVLLVIGLIAGGILKGQELVNSARLRSLINQIDDYRTAVALFQMDYHQLPGNYNQAAERIQPDLFDGKGDGKIDNSGLSYTATNHEAVSFWAHLAARNLIVSPGKVEGGKAQPGKGVPTTKLGGCVTVKYGEFETSKHWFVVGQPNGDDSMGGLLTPEQAQNIDLKVDNGNPLEGRFQARNATDRGNVGQCLKGNSYDTKNKQPACVVYFMM